MSFTTPDARTALHDILQHALQLEQELHALLPDLQANAQVAVGRRRHAAEALLHQAKLALHEIHGAGMRVEACEALYASSLEHPPR